FAPDLDDTPAPATSALFGRDDSPGGRPWHLFTVGDTMRCGDAAIFEFLGNRFLCHAESGRLQTLRRDSRGRQPLPDIHAALRSWELFGIAGRSVALAIAREAVAI